MFTSFTTRLVYLITWLVVWAGFVQAQHTIRTGSKVPERVEIMYEKGLKYLQGAQQPNGTFEGIYGKDPAVIGFCMMAALAHGDDPNHGPYAGMIKKCLNYILAAQNAATGYIGQSMYNHGFATLALAEAYGMVHDERIGPALEKAVQLTVSARKRNRAGGWRYSPEAVDADSTVTGCQLVSLYAARNAGIAVPDETLQGGLKYMSSCRNTNGGYGYTDPNSPGVALSAIGSLTLSLARQKDDPSFQTTLGFLRSHLNFRDLSYPFYFEYYMSQALFHADQQVWNEWNDKNIRYLSVSQRPDGAWQANYSPAYSTALSLLSLALNYRFLPIYEQ